VVYIEGRIYIPNNKNTREEILKENHNSVDVEHPGQQRMFDLIKRSYWWPGLKKMLRNTYKDVLDVNKTKSNTRRN